MSITKIPRVARLINGRSAESIAPRPVITDPILNQELRAYYRRRYESTPETELVGRAYGAGQGALLGAGLGAVIGAIAGTAVAIASAGTGTGAIFTGTALGKKIGASIGAFVGATTADHSTFHATNKMVQRTLIDSFKSDFGSGILNSLSFVGESMDTLMGGKIIKSVISSAITGEDLAQKIKDSHGLGDKGRVELDFSHIRENLKLDFGAFPNFVFDMTGEFVTDPGAFAGIIGKAGTFAKAGRQTVSAVEEVSKGFTFLSKEATANQTLMKQLARSARLNEPEQALELLKNAGVFSKETANPENIKVLKKFFEEVDKVASNNLTYTLNKSFNAVDKVDDALTAMLFKGGYGPTTLWFGGKKVLRTSTEMLEKTLGEDNAMRKVTDFIFGNSYHSNVLIKATTLPFKAAREFFSDKTFFGKHGSFRHFLYENDKQGSLKYILNKYNITDNIEDFDFSKIDVNDANQLKKINEDYLVFKNNMIKKLKSESAELQIEINKLEKTDQDGYLKLKQKYEIVQMNLSLLTDQRDIGNLRSLVNKIHQSIVRMNSLEESQKLIPGFTDNIAKEVTKHIKNFMTFIDNTQSIAVLRLLRSTNLDYFFLELNGAYQKEFQSALEEIFSNAKSKYDVVLKKNSVIFLRDVISNKRKLLGKEDAMTNTRSLKKLKEYDAILDEELSNKFKTLSKDEYLSKKSKSAKDSIKKEQFTLLKYEEIAKKTKQELEYDKFNYSFLELGIVEEGSKYYTSFAEAFRTIFNNFDFDFDPSDTDSKEIMQFVNKLKEALSAFSLVPAPIARIRNVLLSWRKIKPVVVDVTAGGKVIKTKFPADLRLTNTITKYWAGVLNTNPKYFSDISDEDFFTMFEKNKSEFINSSGEFMTKEFVDEISSQIPTDFIFNKRTKAFLGSNIPTDYVDDVFDSDYDYNIFEDILGGLSPSSPKEAEQIIELLLNYTGETNVGIYEQVRIVTFINFLHKSFVELDKYGSLGRKAEPIITNLLLLLESKLAGEEKFITAISKLVSSQVSLTSPTFPEIKRLYHMLGYKTTVEFAEKESDKIMDMLLKGFETQQTAIAVNTLSQAYNQTTVTTAKIISEKVNRAKKIWNNFLSDYNDVPEITSLKRFSVEDVISMDINTYSELTDFLRKNNGNKLIAEFNRIRSLTEIRNTLNSAESTMNTFVEKLINKQSVGRVHITAPTLIEDSIWSFVFDASATDYGFKTVHDVFNYLSKALPASKSLMRSANIKDKLMLQVLQTLEKISKISSAGVTKDMEVYLTEVNRLFNEIVQLKNKRNIARSLMKSGIDFDRYFVFDRVTSKYTATNFFEKTIKKENNLKTKKYFMENPIQNTYTTPTKSPKLHTTDEFVKEINNRGLTEAQIKEFRTLTEPAFRDIEPDKNIFHQILYETEVFDKDFLNALNQADNIFINPSRGHRFKNRDLKDPNLRYVTFDVETTGEKSNRVLSVSLREHRFVNGKPVEGKSKTLYLNHSEITEADISDELDPRKTFNLLKENNLKHPNQVRSRQDMVQEVYDYLGESNIDDTIVIAHNAKFDIKHLMNEKISGSHINYFDEGAKWDPEDFEYLTIDSINLYTQYGAFKELGSYMPARGDFRNMSAGLRSEIMDSYLELTDNEGKIIARYYNGVYLEPNIELPKSGKLVLREQKIWRSLEESTFTLSEPGESFNFVPLHEADVDTRILSSWVMKSLEENKVRTIGELNKPMNGAEQELTRLLEGGLLDDFRNKIYNDLLPQVERVDDYLGSRFRSALEERAGKNSVDEYRHLLSTLESFEESVQEKLKVIIPADITTEGNIRRSDFIPYNTTTEGGKIVTITTPPKYEEVELPKPKEVEINKIIELKKYKNYEIKNKEAYSLYKELSKRQNLPKVLHKKLISSLKDTPYEHVVPVRYKDFLNMDDESLMYLKRYLHTISGIEKQKIIKNTPAIIPKETTVSLDDILYDMQELERTIQQRSEAIARIVNKDDVVYPMLNQNRVSLELAADYFSTPNIPIIENILKGNISDGIYTESWQVDLAKMFSNTKFRAELEKMPEFKKMMNLFEDLEEGMSWYKSLIVDDLGLLDATSPDKHYHLYLVHDILNKYEFKINEFRKMIKNEPDDLFKIQLKEELISELEFKTRELILGRPKEISKAVSEEFISNLEAKLISKMRDIILNDKDLIFKPDAALTNMVRNSLNKNLLEPLKSITGYDDINRMSRQKQIEIAQEHGVGVETHKAYDTLVESLDQFIRATVQPIRSKLSEVKQINRKLGMFPKSYRSVSELYRINKGIKEQIRPINLLHYNSTYTLRLSKKLKKQSELKNKLYKIFDQFKDIDITTDPVKLPASTLEQTKLFQLLEIIGNGTGMKPERLVYNLMESTVLDDQFQGSKLYDELFDLVVKTATDNMPYAIRKAIITISELKPDSYKYIDPNKFNDFHRFVKAIFLENYMFFGRHGTFDGAAFKKYYKEVGDSRLAHFIESQKMINQTKQGWDDLKKMYINPDGTPMTRELVHFFSKNPDQKLIYINPKTGMVELLNTSNERVISEALLSNEHMISVVDYDTYKKFVREQQPRQFDTTKKSGQIATTIRNYCLIPLKVASLAFSLPFMINNIFAASLQNMITLEGKARPLTMIKYVWDTFSDYHSWKSNYLDLNSNYLFNYYTRLLMDKEKNWVDQLFDNNFIDFLQDAKKNPTTYKFTSSVTPESIDELINKVQGLRSDTKKIKQIREIEKYINLESTSGITAEFGLGASIQENKIKNLDYLAGLDDQSQFFSVNNKPNTQGLYKYLFNKDVPEFKNIAQELKFLEDNYDSFSVRSLIKHRINFLKNELDTEKFKIIHQIQNLGFLKGKLGVGKATNAVSMKGFMEINGDIESVFRIGMIRGMVAEGSTVNKASYEVIRRHFIYTDKSVGEKYGEFIIPFLSYPVRALNLFNDLTEDAGFVKIAYSWAKHTWKENEEQQERSPYLTRRKARGDIPVGNRLVGLGNPFTEAMTILSNPGENFDAKMNPVAKPLVDLARGSETNRWTQLPAVSQIRNVGNSLRMGELTSITNQFYKNSQYFYSNSPSLRRPFYNNLYTRSGHSRVGMRMQPTTLQNVQYRVSDTLYNRKIRR